MRSIGIEAGAIKHDDGWFVIDNSQPCISYIRTFQYPVDFRCSHVCNIEILAPYLVEGCVWAFARLVIMPFDRAMDLSYIVMLDV